MKKIDHVWLEVFSDLFVNISAGWIGAAIIVPVSSSETAVINLGVLTVDIILGILFIYLAFELKKIKERKI